MKAPATEQMCAYCFGPITLPPTNNGQPRKYCSITCATAANNRSLRRVCPECGDLVGCRNCGWTPS